MKGLDTSILIRYLAQDDPVQSPRANRIIEKLAASDPGFVSVVVIAEVAWVLRSRFKAQPQEIGAAIEKILAMDAIKVQNEQQVYEAVIAVKAGQGSLADALICALGASAGCAKTLTFDRRTRLSHFEFA